MLFRPIDLFFYDKVFEPLTSWIYKQLGWGNLLIAKWTLLTGIALMLAGICSLIAAPWSSLPRSELSHLYGLVPVMLIEAWFSYKFLKKTLELEERLERSSPDQLHLRDFRDGPNFEVSIRRFLIFLCIWMCLKLPTVIRLPDHEGLVAPEMLRAISLHVVLVGAYFMAQPPRKTRKKERKVFMPTHAYARA